MQNCFYQCKRSRSVAWAFFKAGVFHGVVMEQPTTQRVAVASGPSPMGSGVVSSTCPFPLPLPLPLPATKEYELRDGKVSKGSSGALCSRNDNRKPLGKQEDVSAETASWPILTIWECRLLLDAAQHLVHAEVLHLACHDRALTGARSRESSKGVEVERCPDTR